MRCAPVRFRRETSDVAAIHLPRILRVGGGALAELPEALGQCGLSRPFIVTDRFLVDSADGERWLELPVAGIFELRDGLIARWRDYFDLETIMKQMAG